MAFPRTRTARPRLSQRRAAFSAGRGFAARFAVERARM